MRRPRRNPGPAERLASLWQRREVRLGVGVAAVGGLAALWYFSRRLPGSTLLLSTPSQAFPSSPFPGALVHVPPGYNPSKPLDVVVYFRGFNSCVSVLAGPAQARCREGGTVRKHSDLVGQFDRSGVNAVLVMPELRVEESTGDPGQLGREGGLRRLLEDLLRGQLGDALGGRRGADSIRRVLLCAHSGGYTATAAALSRGGLPNIDTVCLLDAFYGEAPTFTRFAARAATEAVRFSSLYTGGSTEQNSVALAEQLRSRLGPRLVLDGSARPPTPEQWAAPVLVKRVPDEHSWLPLRYFEPFLRSCRLEQR